MLTVVPAKKRRVIFNRKFSYPGDEHPVETYLSEFGVGSQRTMGSALESIADILSDGRRSKTDLAWHLLRAQHVSVLRGKLVQYYSPSTSKRYISALRGVLRAAWRLGLIDRDTMERALDVKSVRGSRTDKGRTLTSQEVASLFEACANDQNSTLGIRDAAILAILFGTGMRRSEAAMIDLKDLDIEGHRIRVIGKGDKERLVFLPPGSAKAVEVWLTARGQWRGPLFCKVSKHGTISETGISHNVIYQVARRRQLQTGLEPFSPHDMRRTLISNLLDDGTDISTIAKMVGHSTVETTASYDRRGQDAQADAAASISVPF